MDNPPKIPDNQGAIFVMPRTSKDWRGAEALWITVAGWSAAAIGRYGDAWVITRDRIATPEEVIHYPLEGQEGDSVNVERRGKWIPRIIKTIVKDVLLWQKSKKWNIIQPAPWSNERVAFVWEQHDLFPGPGRKLARSLGVPLIKYVHAPQVWEGARWGVNRYIWGWALERWIETPALKEADIVACVSQQVANKLIDMGIPSAKIIVSPMAVDPQLFKNTLAKDKLKPKLNLENRFVIGWIGSFRSFHGLDLLVEAFRKVNKQHDDTVLVLVGDGFEKGPMEKLVRHLGLSDVVVFAGKQPFSQIPDYVSLFDIAVVSTRSTKDFHYSPLKLREYLAAGRAVLAPHAGEIPELFKDELHLKLYEGGNIKALVSGLITLYENSNMRSEIAQRGREFILESSTWKHELERVLLYLPK